MVREGVMLAYPYVKQRVERWYKYNNGFVLLQPKLNGVRLKWDGAQLLTSSGAVCVAIPHIVEELNARYRGHPLDGEGYIHGVSLGYITARTSRTVNLHPDYKAVNFHVFDLPIWRKKQANRIAELQALACIDESQHIHRVSTVKGTIDQIEDFTRDMVDQGYEGTIIRNPAGYYEEKRTTGMLKWKPGGSDEYKLIEMIEGKGKYAGTLGAMRVKGSNGQEFNVGSFAVTDAERRSLWICREELSGRAWVMIRYFELTEKNIPPSGVFKCIVGR